jgi:hypothetical protein
VTFVLPYEKVRDKKWLLLHSRHTLNHDGRLELIRFLWGSNGIDPPTIRLVLLPLVKVQSEKDIDGILGSLASGTYNNRWWYFSAVLDQPLPERPRQGPYERLHALVDRNVRRHPGLARVWHVQQPLVVLLGGTRSTSS